MSYPLRYAVLHHTGVAVPHFDVLFEAEPGSALVTYRSDRWPVADGMVLAERLPDHRRIYLEYEGPISGDRGEVRRVAAGNCRLEVEGSIATLHLDDGQRIHLRWTA